MSAANTGHRRPERATRRTNPAHTRPPTTAVNSTPLHQSPNQTESGALLKPNSCGNTNPPYQDSGKRMMEKTVNAAAANAAAANHGARILLANQSRHCAALPARQNANSNASSASASTKYSGRPIDAI